MSQNTEARRKAAEGWWKLLLENHVYDKESVTEVLQNLAEAHYERVAPVWKSNSHSIAWRNYFVAALNRVLKELPPKDRSTEELEKEIERMKSPVKAAAPPNGNADASKPVDTPTTDTNTTFKVDTQGDYKVRIVEDGTTTTLEFLLNGPATVQVQVNTPRAVAAARTPATSADTPADGPDGTSIAKQASR
ncbi:hypothetical protein N0V85_006973 [Neurospora sp. IMI 360204]|nr:hypothetical protein N0V85_006973 [Neurospora sp. IMI 360204]